jgi:hypothetical protein
MMTCEKAVAAYLATLQSGFDCKTQPSGRLAVLTPYHYPDHDNIEVFIRDKGDRVAVSDLGETLRYLDTNGMDVMSTQNALFAARRIAEGFGVEVRDGVLVKDGPAESVGQILFDVLSAVKALGSLVYGNRSYEPVTFVEEVTDYLAANQFHAEQGPPLTGVSGAKYRPSLSVTTASGPIYVQMTCPRFMVQAL